MKRANSFSLISLMKFWLNVISFEKQDATKNLEVYWEYLQRNKLYDAIIWYNSYEPLTDLMILIELNSNGKYFRSSLFTHRETPKSLEFFVRLEVKQWKHPAIFF